MQTMNIGHLLFILPEAQRLAKKYVPRGVSLEHALANKTNGKEMSEVCKIFLNATEDVHTPKKAYEIFTAAEKDKRVLRKELKLLLTLAYESNELMNPVGFNVFEMSNKMISDLPLYKKYNLYQSMFLKIPLIKVIQYTFPDLFHAIIKKHPNKGVKAYEWLATKYKNFQPIHANIGLLGLLPKDGKYGGFVKLLLLSAPSIVDGNLEAEISLGFNIYKNSFIPHGKQREQWFAKLGFGEQDCALWTEIFNREHPEYARIHELFEQVA